MIASKPLKSEGSEAMKTLSILAAIAALLLGACAGSPACDVPGDGTPGGSATTAQTSAPSTGNPRGVPHPVIVTSREKADVATDYDGGDPAQAGAVNNWQGLGPMASGIAGAPPGFKACARGIDVLVAQLAACAPGSKEAQTVTSQLETLSALTSSQYGDWLERAGVVLAPRIEKVIVINNAGVGSAVRAPDPISDAKVKSAGTAIAKQTKEGMDAFGKMLSPQAKLVEEAEQRAKEAEALARRARADADAAAKAAELSKAKPAGGAEGGPPAGPAKDPHATKPGENP